MAKHYVNSRAICPFYKHESRQMVYCQGVVQGSVVHLAFENNAISRDFKERYCRKDYKSCQIYRMLKENENEVK